MVSPPRSGSLQAAATGTPLNRGWLIWLPLGLSSMLLVLFVVVVSRQQEQSSQISDLLRRVQNLEHSRALERTAVLEQQLRSMVRRLQAVEKASEQSAELARQLLSLQKEIQLQRAIEARRSELLSEPPQPPRAAPDRSTDSQQSQPVVPLTP